MEIQFPDSTTSTISLSPPTDMIDPDTECLFTGRLENEADSQVVVVGCKDSQEDTEVTIKSNKVQGGLVNLILTDGVTHIFSLDDLVTGGNFTSNKQEKLDTGVFRIDDDAVEIPYQENRFHVESFVADPGPLPKAVTLETDMYYDNSLLEKFNNNHRSVKQWLSKVFELTKVMMVHPDLIISVHLKKREVLHLNGRIKAQENSLNRLRWQGFKNVGSFFCYDLLHGRDDVGVAYIGAVCSRYGYGININEYFTDRNSEMRTAGVWAHELGHNLGMNHDDDKVHGGPNNPCVGNGHMTDSDMRGWSTCNNKQFEEYYRNSGHTCLRPYEERRCDLEIGVNTLCANCGRRVVALTNTAEECRDICYNRQGCKHWIWHTHQAWGWRKECMLIDRTEGVYTRKDTNTVTGACMGPLPSP